jgi:hypothetical protein
MLRGRRAAIAAAFAIAATAGVTAGCGGGGTGNAVSLDPVAAAATRSQHAGAARVRFAMAVRSEGKSFRLHGKGAIDGTSAKLSFKLGSTLGQMGLPPAAMAKLAHGSIQEIALEQHGDYVVYVRLGFLSSQLPAGEHWIKLDFSELGKSAGIDFGKLLSGSQFQPGDLLAILRGEGAKVEKLGPARIGGVATTHYRVTIDVANVLESKGLTSPLFAGVVSEMPKIPEDVWIGKDGLVRQVRVSYSLTQSGRHLHFGMTMDLSDYGAHIRIAAPPSSAVFDATQLAQGGFGSALFH